MKCPLCTGEIIARREVETDPYADIRQSRWVEYEADGVTRHAPICTQRLKQPDLRTPLERHQAECAQCKGGFLCETAHELIEAVL